MEKKHYSKLYLSLGISWLIMYAVMFLNVSSATDIFLSQTRFYMSLLMTAPMAIVMLLIMGDMYENKGKNRVLIFVAVIVFLSSLLLLRTQRLVGDSQYMKAMIPHHSSAILTSEHANIKDPDVRQLADSIIASQRREIEQMKRILNRLQDE